MQLIFGLLPEYLISYSLFHLKGTLSNKYPADYYSIHNNELSYREEDNITEERKNDTNEQYSGLYPSKNNKNLQSFKNITRPEIKSNYHFYNNYINYLFIIRSRI